MRTPMPIVALLAAILTFQTRAEQPVSSADKWEATIAGFEKADKEHPPIPGGLVIYGSSSARKWAAYQKDLGSFPIVNRGFGGSTLAECARYVDRAVVPCKPAVVLLYGGDNDISQKHTPADVRASFDLLLQRLRKDLPAVKVIVLSEKPAPIRKAQYETLKEVNRLLREACEKGESLTFIDIWTPMMGPDNQPIPDLFGPDRSHCNEKGYALWNSLVKPVLEKVFEKSGNDAK